MQSRLASTAAKLNKIASSAARNNRLLHRSLASSGGAEGRTADPDVHATVPEDTYPEERPLGTQTKEQPQTTENDPFVPPKPPLSPSAKLESNAVNQPIDPLNQQRRRHSSDPLKDVSCVGMDGTPWPEDEMDRESQIRERERDDKEYFKDHKASMLSEIEVADTRKPVTIATDGTGGGGYFGGESGVVLFRPEQIDTAEDSLLRAKRMWLENATRGDPESPHGRVLRTLRGEFW